MDTKSWSTPTRRHVLIVAALDWVHPQPDAMVHT
jgi:hypothetical protein